MMRPLIAVIGAGDDPAPHILEAARTVGRLLAERGAVLLTGGLGGVMEAASAGARDAGGLVVGLLPQSDPRGANPHVDVAIATGLGEARNAVIATAARALIAVGGEHGTLSEIAHGLKLGRPVVVLHSRWEQIPGVIPAPDPVRAVETALAEAARR